nr:MAG TPA: GAGA binding protein-like family [Caudoviricetes sp.]
MFALGGWQCITTTLLLSRKPVPMAPSNRQTQPRPSPPTF